MYRCTTSVDSDDSWNVFVHYFRARLVANLKASGAGEVPGMIDSADLLIHHDSKLSGMRKDDLRLAFRTCVITRRAKEILPDMAGTEYQRHLLWENPRFNFCVHTYDDVVRSIMQENNPIAEDTVAFSRGYVNLVWACGDLIDGPKDFRLKIVTNRLTKASQSWRFEEMFYGRAGALS